jgi:tRNA-specific 2-thiouridylase
VLGEHSGTHHFTVGQRRGLRIAAAEPLYVIATEPQTQRVTVGQGSELMRSQLTARDVNWLSIAPINDARPAKVKIRNKHLPAEATLVPTADPAVVSVQFQEPQRAITPGQAAVFYEGDLVLGGGWIS